MTVLMIAYERNSWNMLEHVEHVEHVENIHMTAYINIHLNY